jgi:hypothetical protein
LKREPDQRSCRIFGHDCPVFPTAEPFTETRQLRNIRRAIPRAGQFRVLKRENQICSECGKSVMDADVEFDHIIPWSKGGSSDESNIRLLCQRCNRRRGTAFEKQFLIDGPGDHVVGPSGIEVVEWLLLIARFGWDFYRSERCLPTADDYASAFTRKKVSSAEQFAAQQFADMVAFLQTRRPSDVSASVFKALRMRWGAVDGQVRRIRDVLKQAQIETPDLVSADRGFVQRLGYSVKPGAAIDARWARL